MPNANFPNNPNHQQMPPQKKSNSGCVIAGAIIGCLFVVLLCIGSVIFLFTSILPMLSNTAKPMMRTLAFLNEVCKVKITEEDKQVFVGGFTAMDVEEKEIKLNLTPREFYDTAFSNQLKSKYTYEEFMQDIQPLTTESRFCQNYIQNNLNGISMFSYNNNTETEITLDLDGYVIRIKINPVDGMITDFKVEESRQTELLVQ